MIMDLGALGFWIFLAAVVVGGMWSEARKKTEKHETLRRIVEKTGTIDEAKWKELFKEAPSEEPKPGSGYRLTRVLGTIIMFGGAGIATCISIAMGLAKVFEVQNLLDDIDQIIPMLGVSAGIAMIGLGVFFSSRFCEPPSGSRNEPPAR
jgi:hypothetical protein